MISYLCRKRTKNAREDHLAWVCISAQPSPQDHIVAQEGERLTELTGQNSSSCQVLR